MKLSPDDFEMSPLAAYGLVAMALILGFLGLEKYAAAEQSLEQTVISAQTELATLSAIKGTSYWTERLAQSATLREQLKTEIWQGTTSGVVAAELQQALRGLGQTYKFTNIQVRVEPELSDADGMSLLSFEFAGRARTSKSLADFLEGLALSPKIIVIDEANISQSVRDRRPPRIAVSGIIPVQITTPGDAQ